MMLPAPVSSAGAKGARDLDVRPILAKGGDPFALIIKTINQLADTEALHLIVGFEPVPLYSVLASMGRAAHSEEHDGDWHVWFYRDAVEARKVPNPAARVPLQPVVDLDVRGLEPPTPMVTILETLAELGAGARLRVRHHREPVLLYDKLELRGYAARCEKRAEGDYLIHIAPKWAFESP